MKKNSLKPMEKSKKNEKTLIKGWRKKLIDRTWTCEDFGPKQIEPSNLSMPTFDGENEELPYISVYHWDRERKKAKA